MHRRSRQNGFTLIELLIAALVMGIGLVSVAGFQTYLLKESNLTKQRMEALNFAEQRLEQLRTMVSAADFFALQTGSQDFTPADTPGLNTSYSVNWTVLPATSGKTARIDVTVTWPDPNNAGAASNDTTVRLATMVSSLLPVAATMSSDLAPPGSLPTPPETVTCNCEDAAFQGTGRCGRHMTPATFNTTCGTCCNLGNSDGGHMGRCGGGMGGMGGTLHTSICRVASGAVTLMN